MVGCHAFVPRPETTLPCRPATTGTPRRPRGRFVSAMGGDLGPRGRFVSALGREPCENRFGIEPSSISKSAGGNVCRPSKVRTFDNIPMMQSSVDQVVFNRDMDMSGDTKFDKEFISQFRD